MPDMTKKERILAAVEGKPVDRVPFGLWHHFPEEDASGKRLVEAELAFYRRFDPDFLKVMHDLPYPLPDGLTVLESPEDWEKLAVLDPRAGNYGTQLSSLKALIAMLGEETLIIDTVFDPFSQAEKLSGDTTIEQLRKYPEPVLKGLSVIADSVAAYASACMEIGLSGIYFAVQCASRDKMTEAECRDLFLPLNRRVLTATDGKAAFNAIHLHGDDLMFELGSELPCQALCWSDRATGPELKTGLNRSYGAVMGGINERTVARQSPKETANDVRDALKQTGGSRTIIGPGCAVPTPHAAADFAAWEERLAAIRSEL